MNKVINGKYIYIKDNTNKKIRIFLKETLKNNSKQVFYN